MRDGKKWEKISCERNASNGGLPFLVRADMHRESSLFDKIDDDIFIIFIDGLDEKFWYDFEQRRWVYYLDLIMIELIYI